MKCLVHLFLKLVVVVGIFSSSILIGQDQIHQAEILKWIGGLNSLDHADRDNATESLRRGGKVTIPFLWQAVESKEPEVRSRAQRILEAFMDSDDEPTREAILASVVRIAKSGDTVSAQFARKLIVNKNQDDGAWITNQQQGIVSRDMSRVDRPIVDVKLDRTRGIDPGFHSDTLQDSDFARIGKLHELKSLTLEYRTRFSDDALKHLKDLTKLETLNLSRTSINGSGLQHIVRLPEFRALNLNHCVRIKDDELKSLSGATSLKEISLDGTSGDWQSDDGWQAALSLPYYVSGAVQDIDRLNHQLSRYRGGVSDKGLEPLSTLDLQSLSLKLTRITDGGIRQISKINSLNDLYLDYTAVSDMGLIDVSKLSQLKKLSLNFTYVTDKGLEEIGKLSDLESLSMRGIAISDKGIQHLARLTNLQHLDLQGTHITDASIDVLVGLPKLNELNLGRTKIGFSGLRQLASSCPEFSLQETLVSRGLGRLDGNGSISSLDLRGQGLKDNDLVDLKQFTNLRSLILDYNPITNDGLAALSNLTQLDTLMLDGTKISDLGLIHLDSLTKLNRLDVTGTDVTFTGLRQLLIDRQGRPAIDVIRMVRFFDELFEEENEKHQGYYIDLNCSGLNDDDLVAVCKIPEIRSLKLARNSLTDEGISKLSAHPELEVLWIGGEDITGQSLNHVARLKSLEMVWVTDSPIHDADLDALIALPKLRVLNLCGCPITDASVDVLKEFKALETLIVDVLSLSATAVDRLKSSLPNLEIHRSQQGALRAIRGRERQRVKLSKIMGYGVEQVGVTAVVKAHPLIDRFGDEYFELATEISVQQLDHADRLKELDTVDSIYLSLMELPDGTLKHLRDLPNLRKFSLIRSQVSNSEIKHLAGLEKLESLSLHRSTVGDNGLRLLKNLSGVKRLALGGSGTSINELVCLKSMPNLEILDLNRTRIDDDDLPHVNRLIQLEKLSAREAMISNFDLPELKELAEVDLAYTFVDDGLFDALKNHRNLKSLNVGSTYITKTGLDEFRKNRPDVKMWSTSALTDEEFQIVEPFRQHKVRLGVNGRVTSIDLHRLRLTPERLDRVLRLKSLQRIKLRGPFPDQLFQKLTSLKKLTSVFLYDATVANDQVEQLANLPELESLRMSRCLLSDGVIERIGSLHQLKSLSLSDCHVSDDDLTKLKNLQNLSWLVLSGTQISDRGLEEIVRLNELQTVYLDRTSVTANGLKLLNRSPRLRDVYARACGIEATGLGEVKFRFNSR